MTPVLKKTADVVVALLLLLAGVWLVYASWFDAAAKDLVLDQIRNSPFFSTVAGLVLILSVLLRVVAGSKGRKKDSFIDFQSEDGSVGISTKAIQDFIERVGKEFAAVKSIESRLVQEKGMLDVAMDVKVLSGNKIPELSQVLQQRVRESVRESLGLEEIRNITIKVKEIVGEPAKSAEGEPDGG
jgi:uncharacterized alkaline shock family protein YloU